MTKEELAEKLNNIDMNDDYFLSSKKDNEYNLVIVYGASDDLIQFRSGINDEGDCYEGGDFLIDKIGLLPSFEQLRDYDEDEEEFERYFARKPKAKKITAIWDNGEYSWTYETDIPHATFDIMEGNEKYCRGIIFSLDDLE